MNCRHCCTPLEQVFLDLGFAPPSNARLSEADLIASNNVYAEVPDINDFTVGARRGYVRDRERRFVAAGPELRDVA